MADVLIVDDDSDLAEALGAALESFGHSVRTASNGEAGLLALAKRLPDLIVLDIEMPLLSGPEMAARMLVDDAGREMIPVLLSSGYAELPAVAAVVGTPYVLPKPASIEALNVLVERALVERTPPIPRPVSRLASPDNRSRP